MHIWESRAFVILQTPLIFQTPKILIFGIMHNQSADLIWKQRLNVGFRRTHKVTIVMKTATHVCPHSLMFLGHIAKTRSEFILHFLLISGTLPTPFIALRLFRTYVHCTICIASYIIKCVPNTPGSVVGLLSSGHHRREMSSVTVST